MTRTYFVHFFEPSDRLEAKKSRKISLCAIVCKNSPGFRTASADSGPTSSPLGTTGVRAKGVIPLRALSRFDRPKRALVEAVAERPRVKSGPSRATVYPSIAILSDGAGLRPSQHGRVTAGCFFVSRLYRAEPQPSDWRRVDAPCVVPYGPRAKVQGRNR